MNAIHAEAFGAFDPWRGVEEKSVLGTIRIRCHSDECIEQSQL